MKPSGRAILVLALVPCSASTSFAWGKPRCTYTYTVWNTQARKTVARRKVSKPYAELTQAEKGPLGCTPCEEDQVKIVLSNKLSLRVCRHAAERVQRALDDALANGQEIKSVLAYHPQMSKGPADSRGNRTELSNHSFGVAVDVNTESNGLYTECFSWSKSCVRLKGGRYFPDDDPLSLTEESPVVGAFAREGFRWGGKIEGRQKDFMHFSPSGY